MKFRIKMQNKPDVVVHVANIHKNFCDTWLVSGFIHLILREGIKNSLINYVFFYTIFKQINILSKNTSND